jgi:hypothetical protein
MLGSISHASLEVIQQHPYVIAISIVGSIILANRLAKPIQRLPNLRGPAPNSWFWGVSDQIFMAIDDTPLYEDWARTHGSTFILPRMLGDKGLVIMDPKALAAFLARDTQAYKQSEAFARFLRNSVSR